MKTLIYKSLCLLILAMLVKLNYAQERPFATIKVHNDVYFDQTEVDVGSWLSYYTWTLIHEGFATAQKVLPDSSAVEPELWAYIKAKSADYIDVQGTYSLQPIGYFGKECSACTKFGKRLYSERRYCAMLNFPITGVTFEQVVGFCEWRTQVQGKNMLVFRLPTPEEWKNFAMNGLTEIEKKGGIIDSLTKKKCPKFNYKILCNCDNDDYQGKLNGIGLYSPEKNGAYDVFGNVSEMTSVSGIAKGGNFGLHANQCHVDSIQKYTKPQTWLGFRCIAVKKGNNTTLSNTKNNVISSIATNSNQIITDTRDGKNYRTVQIKDQIWMAENLAFKPDSGDYWSWNNDTTYVSQYGYLYSWKIAQKVCPTGWHLPSKVEFETLLQNAGNENPKTAFKELTEMGGTGFYLQVNIGTRLGKKNFSNLESALWTSTEKNHSAAWALYYLMYDSVFQMNGHVLKKTGLPVRCIKDY